MMDEKTVNEQYNHICTLLERKRLKEALVQLESQLWQAPDWELKNQLEQLQTSYQYMLEYMRQGAEDPERWNLHKKLIADTWEIADRSRILMLDAISSKYYHEVRRTPKSATLATYDLTKITEILECFNEILSTENQASKDTEEQLKRHEETLKYLFLQTWTNTGWTSQEEEAAQGMLLSEQISMEDLCVFTSSIMLSLMECFDTRKIIWLLDAYKYPQTHVSQRALVSLLIILHIYKERIGFYPGLQEKIASMSELTAFRKDVAQIYRQMLLCQETEKIDKKMREEIIPEMIKNTSAYMRSMRFGTEENEDENNDLNPDWESIEQSGLSEKLREMSELQLEGADIYMSSFASLKNYPFFKEVYNWFYPFTEKHSEIFKIQNKESGVNQFLKLILQSGFFSNSDKYSFFFTIHQLTGSQQNMMIGQLTEQQEAELMEAANTEKLKKYSDQPEVISNQYLHDLYRFFKLSVRRQEFRDIFKEKLDLHHIPLLKEILYTEEVLSTIANFYFQKERWEEATEVYQELEKLGFPAENAVQYYQKLGFTLQKRKKYADAIGAYRKAEILKEDNIWNNRHLATCYRLTRNFTAALSYYRKIEEAAPNDPNIVFQIASCLFELGENEEALNYFFKLDFMENNSVKAWRGIGWCSFVCRKYEQSMKYYERIIGHKPLPIDYMNAGHVAWAMGNVANAAVFYGKAITANGGNREEFLSMFEKDKNALLEQGIREEEIPLMLDLI